RFCITCPSFKCFIRSCFFFQAEDGIRDATVTGVQTCALPIFAINAVYSAAQYTALIATAITSQYHYTIPLHVQQQASTTYILARSEERRVGKECRSRLSECH